MATPIRIRIGASKDSSVDKVFGTIRKQADRTAKAINRDNVAAFRTISQAAERASRRQITTSAEAQRQILAELRRMEQAGARSYERLASAAEKSANRATRANRRTTTSFSTNTDLDRFARRTSHRATRFFAPTAPLLSYAGRAGRDILRGYGIDTSISGSLERNVSLEKLSTEAANSARLAGQEHDPADIARRVRDVSGDRKLSREDTAAGLFEFQKITGDLQLGLTLLDKMAERASATSTSMEDYAAAMGNASNLLGDVDDKAGRLLHVMDGTTVQGARGAVEVSDMAKHMARAAAAAAKFGGNAEKNLRTMGALAQLARAEGGAPSAAEAARSVVGFANTFQKSARLKAFESITGKSAFADSKHTTLRAPEQLIKDALVGTGGDLNKMNKIFMDVVGARAVSGLTKAFNQAGGGTKGLRAVDAKLANYTTGTDLSQKTLDELNARRDATTAAKVQRWQNAIDDVVYKTQHGLTPALEGVAPKALHLADVLGRTATWAIENPKSAIGAAIGLSIARASVESAMRTGIERIFTRMGGGKAAALTLTAAAVTLIAQRVTRNTREEQERQREATHQATETTQQGVKESLARVKESVDMKDLPTAERHQSMVEQRLEQAKRQADIDIQQALEQKAKQEEMQGQQSLLRGGAMNTAGGPHSAAVAFAGILGARSFFEDIKGAVSGDVARAQDNTSDANLQLLRDQRSVISELAIAVRESRTAIDRLADSIERRPQPTGSNLGGP